MSRAKRARLICRLAAAMMIVLVVAGCTDRGPTFIDHQASYTKTTALDLLTRSDASRFAQRPTSDANMLRHAALTALRRHGSSASNAADLITRTFPQAAHGVPVYVELGSFDGTPATLLIEATGPAAGTLGTKRLWILGEDGRVLLVATR